LYAGKDEKKKKEKGEDKISELIALELSKITG
jgi:hypothetical protein